MRPKERARAGRRRRRVYIALGLVVVVLAVFLPGPNGLVRVLLKRHQASRMERELDHLHSQVDSLEARCRFLADPDSARELARKTLGLVPADSASVTARRTQ